MAASSLYCYLKWIVKTLQCSCQAIWKGIEPISSIKLYLFLIRGLISIEFGNRTLSNSNNVRTFYVRTTDLYNQASVQTEVFLKGGSIYLILTWDEKLRSK